MTHPSNLQLSMLADKALGDDESAELNAHITACGHCRSRLNNLQAEVVHLKDVLAHSEFSTIPEFVTPLKLKDMFVSTMMLSGFAWVLVIFWQSLLSDIVLDVVSWFTNVHLTESISVAVETVFYISEKGLTMLNALYTFALYFVVLGVICWYGIPRMQWKGALGACFCVLMFSVTYTAPVQALEIRRAEPPEQIMIDEDEIINESLVVFGDSASIRGVVDGDLIVFARRITVEGEVTGNIISFTQSVTVSGEVGGSVMSFAQSVDLDDATILSNLWAFASDLEMSDEASVAGDATVFTNIAVLAGFIGKDLTSFGESIEVDGEVGDDVLAFSNQLSLQRNARVEGNVDFHTANGNEIVQANSAEVGGTIEVHTQPRRGPRPNRFATGGFYFNQLLKIAGGLISGMALLALFPVFRQSSISNGMEALKSAGFGFLGLISLPIIAVLAAITFVGFPLGVFTIFTWVLLIYFAKIIFAWVLGNMLLSSHEGNKFALPLFAGLVVVVVVINVPVVGAILNFCMTLIGAGLLVKHVINYVDSLSSKTDMAA